jgi:hypothetical protein
MDTVEQKCILSKLKETNVAFVEVHWFLEAGHGQFCFRHECTLILQHLREKMKSQVIILTQDVIAN